LNYRLSEQQKLIKKTVSSLLKDLVPADKFRQIIETEGFSKKSWEKLATDGWIGMLADAQSSDEAFSLMDMICVSEEIGAKLFPGPYSLVSSFIIPVLTQLLPEGEHEKSIESVINGSKLMTAVLPAARTKGQEVVVNWSSLSISEDDDHIYLSGQNEHVQFAQYVDEILLPVENTWGGVSLAIIKTETPGLIVESETSVDLSKRLATLRFDHLKIEKSAFIGGWNTDHRQVLSKNLASYILCLTSEMIGGAQKVLEKTVEHVKERKQFGHPIAVYQAVKHQLADMYTFIENAKSYNFYTAWKLLNEPKDSLLHVAASRVYAAEMYKDVCEKAIQLQGGMGFTWEQETHFWYKSALYHQNHMASARTFKRYIFNNL
jgi:acyl-CoA dehydrogenase